MAGAPIVLFDLDNTLIHSRIQFLEIRREIITALVGAGVLSQPPPDPRVRAIPEWMDLVDERAPELSAGLWQAIERYEQEGMLHGTVDADVQPTLDQLRGRGYRVAVLTNNGVHAAEEALRHAGLLARCDLVLGRGVVEKLKPDGAGVRQAWSALGQGLLTFVGDSWIDAMAAQRANVGARIVAFRPRLDEMTARGITPWAVIHSLGELLELCQD